jgi:hypothetical protein
MIQKQNQYLEEKKRQIVRQNIKINKNGCTSSSYNPKT